MRKCNLKPCLIYLKRHRILEVEVEEAAAATEDGAEAYLQMCMWHNRKYN